MRQPGAVGSLIALVRAYERTPFRWGHHDCCKFAARCVDAMTGTHYADALSYRNRKEARAFIASHGSIVAAVSAFLGTMRDGLPDFGDVALIDTVHGEGVGVCIGPSIAIPGDTGLVYYKREAAKGHWAVNG